MIVGIWLIVCASYDYRWRRLPNWLTLGAYLPAIAFLLVLQQSVLGSTVSSAIYGWGLAVLLTLPAYALKWLGAGDVKMLSAMGLLGGLPFMLTSYVLAAVLSVAVIVFILTTQRFLPFINLKLAQFNINLPITTLPKGKFLPFGTLLGIGGMLTLLLNQLNGGGL